ncbi:MAG: hypothetical protein GAK34_03630 [Delftia tsuruhatensis]|nr:MAG: hypothetical protein GAK34_03630 [Delftia tsuruhatensis]
MSIVISNVGFEEAKKAIVKKFKENEKTQEITTWELKGTDAAGYQLHFKSQNWGICGYFALTENTNGKLRFVLRVNKEHYETGSKWPTLKGALHGDLVQLLINHFEHLTEDNGFTVFNSVAKA